MNNSDIIKRKFKKQKNKDNNKFNIFFSKILITVIITMLILIGVKSSTKFKTMIYKNVYDTNISFASINNLYQKYFGSPIPFKNLLKDKTKPVFKENLSYNSKESYNDGVKLLVNDNYLVPLIDTGLVVFVGEKDGYGNTIIVNQVNGIDVWYGNLNKINVNLYDYIEKGTLLGEVKNNELYLLYKKNGETLNYEEYLQ